MSYVTLRLLLLMCRDVFSQVVLVSEAYLTALIPSFKKRICHFCLVDHQRRLEASCSKFSFKPTDNILQHH